MTISTATLQAGCIKDLGQNSEDTILLERSLEWLNEALEDIQMYLPDAEFLQTSEMPLTLIVGQATYAMPPDFMQLIQIRNDDESVIIEVIPRAEFDRRHPDPSTEATAIPSDGTLEYDRVNHRNILRIAPAPDDDDVFMAIMKRWHPTLSAAQAIQWDKLQYVIARRAAYFGSLEIYPDNEFIQYRQELNTLSLNKIQALQQIVAIQKPRPNQIPTVLKKSEY